MNGDQALNMFTKLETDYARPYGLGEWHQLTAADKDYEFMQADTTTTAV